ncbi:hypothetical protein GX586_08835 [bacterium]|nr:hypothetical protein [bacterium]
MCASASPPEQAVASGVFLTNWAVLGPFPHVWASGDMTDATARLGYSYDFLTPMGGEQKAVLVPGAQFPGRPGMVVTGVAWQTGEIDLDHLFGMKDLAVAYASMSLVAPEATSLYLHAGSDDSLKVWIDGQCVLDRFSERGFIEDEDWTLVTLGKGAHSVLVKCEDYFGAWKFSVRLLDASAHLRTLAARVDEQLSLQLRAPTAAFDRLSIRLALKPPLTDFVARVSGAWISSDGAKTQAFEHGMSSVLSIPEAFDFPGACRLEVVAQGLPDRQPRTDVNLYLTDIGAVISNRALRAQALLGMLSSNDVARRLVLRHEGLLRYSFQRLAALAQSNDYQFDISTHLLLTRIDRILDALATRKDYLGGLHGTYEAAYISPVDGSGQPFSLTMPRPYDPAVPTPLIVLLHDLGEDHLAETVRFRTAAPHFTARPLGRGRTTGYLGLAVRDVLDVIGYMTNFYNVDTDRICLIGSGMGGQGVWVTAATAPDVFASVAALNGYSAELPLDRFRNLPVLALHGGADIVIPAALSRAAVDYLMRRAFPVVHGEIPSAGYRLEFAAERFHPVDWMVNFRRVPAPREVIVDSVFPPCNRMYWLSILAAQDPRASCRAHGRFMRVNELILALDNVGRAAIALPEDYVENDALLSVIVNGQQQSVPAPLPSVLHVNAASNGFIFSTTNDAPVPSIRPYQMGSWQNLYAGEPLMIVYGTTAADPARLDALRACARQISRWSFVGRSMDAATIPVRSDKEVTQAELDACNVILLGGPQDNGLVAQAAASLATPLAADSISIAGERLPLDGRGVWLCQYNPLAPARLAWIWASPDAAFYSAGAAWYADWTLPAVDPPDLLVVNIQTASYCRATHFGADWKPYPPDVDSPRIAPAFASQTNARDQLAHMLIGATMADFAWIPLEQSAAQWDAQNLRAREAAALLMKNPCVVLCDVTGRDIRALNQQTAVAGTAAGRLVPQPVALRGQREYRVAVLPRELRSFNEAVKTRIGKARYRFLQFTDTLADLLVEPSAGDAHPTPPEEWNDGMME